VLKSSNAELLKDDLLFTRSIECQIVLSGRDAVSFTVFGQPP
jgi:hypothetical protein